MVSPSVSHKKCTTSSVVHFKVATLIIMGNRIVQLVLLCLSTNARIWA
jgi:hypothetical protein